MKFLILLVLTFSSFTLCSKTHLASSSYSTTENQIIKKFRSFDVEFIRNLQYLVEKDEVELFIECVRENGSFVMDPIHSNLLAKCVKLDKIKIIKAFFNNCQEGFFDILFEALKLAAPTKPAIVNALALSKYLKSDDQKHLILEYFLKQNNWRALKILLKNGISFVNWRGRRGQSLPHVIVQKDWTGLISLIDHYSFDAQDKLGNTPIFYVSSPEMVKLIRKHFPGARDQLNKHKKTIWQMASEAKKYEILDALISPESRFKKFRMKQANFYKFPWVSTGSILHINRRNILKDSFEQVKLLGSKWFHPKHKFFIKFVGEEGMDSGGLKLEWISLLIQKLFVIEPQDPPVFVKVDEESDFFVPNAAEYGLEDFKIAGSLIGLALAMNVGLKAKFIPAIYRAFMHERLDLALDLLEQSPVIHKNLQILKSPAVNLAEMGLTMPGKPFSYVTRRNLGKYVQEYSFNVLQGRYNPEISALVSGFESVLPVQVSQYFKYNEFKKILTGKPVDFTAEQFLSNSTFDCEQSKAALGTLITEMTVEQRGLLFTFITGMNSLPVNGISGLQGTFTVEIDKGLIGKLPTSSTCAFLLKLPPFTDYETFKETLMKAIEWTNTTDNEPGVTDVNESIVLGFDDEDEAEVEAQDEYPESDVSSSEN